MSVDWKNGYSATYYATFVDPRSWADTERFELTGGSIKRSTSELLESADLKCKNYTDIRERWIRVWFDVKQGNNYSHIPLFTGLATSPDRSIDGNRITQTIQCYSVLMPAQDILLDRGYYAPMETDGANLIKDLLSVLKSPVEISEKIVENRKLTQAIVAESGENHLSMVHKILYAMNWRLSIDGYGRITIKPYDKDPVAIFNSVNNDVLEPSLSISYDWYSCPNVVRAIVDDEVAIAKDKDENSPLSIQNRGREVWYEDTSCILNDKETLHEYAERLLKELQSVSMEITYSRRFNPDIYPTDVVALRYPVQGIDGYFMVSSQTIDLGFNAKTNEEVVKV